MKSFIKILLLLLLPFITRAQDTTITISPKMLDPYIIRLGDIDGWIFKNGNDLTLPQKDINIIGWRKMRPSELSEELADKNGKLECWFRLKFKLDTTFGNTSLNLAMSVWGASEVYVDEKLLAVFGNTGINGKPFKEHSFISDLPVSFNIEKGKEHLLAIHFVDFLSPLPPFYLKSKGSLNEFVLLVPPETVARHVNYVGQYSSYREAWLSINIVLCLLFWLLAFQNRDEKNLLFIAVTSTIILLYIYCRTFYISRGSSYISNRIAELATPLLVSASLICIVVLISRIFRQKLNLLSKILSGLILVCGILLLFFWNWFILILQVVPAVIAFSYYILISWKTLKGAQWAIVTGFFLAALIGLFSNIGSFMGLFQTNSADLFIQSGISLSIPLSLLVYVSIRFREIIHEVRHHSQKIIQLSEEKKQQALNQQKILQEEVNRQTAELRNTLENLKSTQAQLIQSEKMASLGELTAGIAHEIQNPLNFVNNFSEVNNELIEELKSKKSKLKNESGDEDEEILSDIFQNNEKISFHGKRADAIVKGMLQHSRASTGKKEPRDINALADEYLRLSYHGMRAKDKSFNAEIKTDFDNSIGKINIVPQDIGRVLLNLFNNAFYAVMEKKKNLTGFGNLSGLESYVPAVTVVTQRLNNKIEIKIADNGIGIPQKVVDKIFQPFFTTKPTGQGTGLGLSLSYDIIKAHGGEIKVETKEGEGSEFIVQLPRN
jgi:signal transduction histidine kinase